MPAVLQPDGCIAERGAGDEVELVGLGHVVEEPGGVARNVVRRAPLPVQGVHGPIKLTSDTGGIAAMDSGE